MSYYDTMQVCLYGHKVTGRAESRPEDLREKCSKCGKETITACNECNSKINGYKHIDGVGYADSTTPPSFCHSCGNAYPWTISKIEGLKTCIDEIAGLSEPEREKLKEVAYDLVIETPKTKAASLRYENMLSKLTSENQQSKQRAITIAKFIFEIATEAAKDAVRSYIPGGL